MILVCLEIPILRKDYGEYGLHSNRRKIPLKPYYIDNYATIYCGDLTLA